MLEILADVFVWLVGPPGGERRWVRVLYVLLAIAGVAAAAVIVVLTWP